MIGARLMVAEPPVAYALRPTLVIDASVLASTVFPETWTQEAVAWIRGRRLCAPFLLSFELCNVARQKVRRRAISSDFASRAIQDFEDVGVELFAVPPLEAFNLAHRYDLSGYDASYLWLADHLQAPLATFDAKLGAAAQKHLSGEDPSATW